MIVRAIVVLSPAIDQTDNRSWSSGVVPADPDAELGTNEEWRGIMQRARKDQGLSQAELAGKIGTSQNIVSLIENGEVLSSKFVLPICRKLKIPPPMHFESEEQRAWSQLGHVLRAKNMKQFRRAMALVESMVDDEEEAVDEVKPAPARPHK